jgi:hypothetical protein
VQFPSESGVFPVKKGAKKKNEAKMYTDTTGACERVPPEIKVRQINKISG